MGLCRLIKAKKFAFTSLDLFMLQMHAKEIAEVLDSLTAFAERVVRLIQHDEAACSWWLNRHLAIHRDFWRDLSCRVMTLIKLLGFLDLDGSSHEAPWPPLTPWPDVDLLQHAARRAAKIYGPFGAPDKGCRSLLSR